MKPKLVLTSMILGIIVCSMSAVVGATDVAQPVSDTARHDSVQPSWMDRTDITTARAKMLDKVRRQDMIVESFDDIEYDYLAPIDHL